jgi:uncharacterized protein DUF3147
VIIKFNWTALKEVSWKDYAIRFVLGGLVTVATGLIAKRFGPAVGGLFLAFPAIFPASATLIATQQRDQKERRLLNGLLRGRLAVALDARGAVLGTVGLTLFSLVVWRLIVGHSAVAVLLLATLVWTVTSCVLWLITKRVR